MTSSISENVARFSGFADCYDKHRPRPPAAVSEILSQLSGQEMPRLVVDLGSGTGLSTRLWAGWAQEVVGIEPNADMRQAAEAHAGGARFDGTGIYYREGLSTRTGLPSGCADIVCCSQSFHWMEPTATLGEAARLLRAGGVFAAIDCDWPPTLPWQAMQAYRTFMNGITALEQEQGIAPTARWPKTEHLANIVKSGHFRFTHELAVHQVESGNAARLVGLARSFGSVAGLLKLGLSETAIGLTALREAADRLLGKSLSPWYFTYRVRLGVK